MIAFGIGKTRGLIDQDHFRKLRTLCLVHRQHLAKIELVIIKPFVVVQVDLGVCEKFFVRCNLDNTTVVDVD